MGHSPFPRPALRDQHEQDGRARLRLQDPVREQRADRGAVDLPRGTLIIARQGHISREILSKLLAILTLALRTTYGNNSSIRIISFNASSNYSTF